MHGHLDTVNILLRAGISRDARTKVDRTPLHVAAQAGHFEIVQILLKQHAIIDASDMVSISQYFMMGESNAGGIGRGSSSSFAHA